MSRNVPKAFIFDLDGTIYLGDDIIDGALESLQWVRSIGAKVRFVTNNPRFSRSFYRDKLKGMGIDVSLEEVVTSAQVTANYLAQNKQYGSIYVIGEEQLLHELREKDVPIVEDISAKTVLVSFDTKVDYEKLMIAYKLLLDGAHFITTNPDAVCPTPDGGLIDSGALIAALETSTKRKLEKVIGKPSAVLGKLLLQELEVSPSECVVVGDRLNTDVKLGNTSLMQTVWIRAYEEEYPSNEADKPTYTVRSIKELPNLF